MYERRHGKEDRKMKDMMEKKDHRREAKRKKEEMMMVDRYEKQERRKDMKKALDYRGHHAQCKSRSGERSRRSK